MVLPQIMFNLRKSLCIQIVSYYTNRMYELHSKKLYNYQTTFYRCYARKSKINEQPNTFCNDYEVQTANILNSNRMLKLKKIHSQPKHDLDKIYDVVKNEFDKLCISYVYTEIRQSTLKYKCIINVTWPYEASFCSIASNKKMAAHNAALICLDWLYQNKKINDLKPIFYDYKSQHDILKSQQFVKINLTSESKNKIQSVIDVFNDEIKSITTIPHITEINVKEEVRDLSSSENSSQLMQNLQRRNNMKMKIDLPIMNYKEKILNSLQNNQVLVIKGDTGCGKSTQVPQFILNAYIEQNKRHECNIIVSEPRKISAISLAERVAYERSEKIGNTVGYHVRFYNKMPKNHGSILFCTTGMLLRKLEYDPTLEKVSHIIIDEAHERSLHTDLLLKLCKDLLEHKSHIKLIIMSASINAEIFQEYFSSATINVPGELHHVEMHFIDDIDFLNNNLSNWDTLMTKEIPFNEIVCLIQWIINNKPPGAILCFLPGWREIKLLHDMLQNEMDDLLILPLHSKLPNHIQQKVFKPAPANMTKIVLATDVAETGITIPDISYVIDTAIKRETLWNEKKSLSSLCFCPISQANIYQRKGRAGRLKPGESYHLITREKYNELDLYPKPEILRISLDEAIIFSKTVSRQKASDFFNDLIDPPSATSIISAVNSLKNLGILDEDENLTSLGERVSYISLNPKISKAVILSCILQCLYPILTIATIFGSASNYGVSLNENLHTFEMLRKQKLKYHKTSDHIAVSEYFSYVESSDDNCFQTVESTYYQMQRFCMLHMDELINSGILSETSDFDYLNAYSQNNELIRAILFAATNHLIKKNHYGYKRGVFTKRADILTTETNNIVQIKNESVNYKRKTWPSDILIYVNKIEFVNRHISMVLDTSMISPLSVLLFSQTDVQCKKILDNASTEEEQICISINNIKNLHLLCEPEIADVLLELRSILWNVVYFILRYENKGDYEDKLHLIRPFKKILMDLVSELLTESSRHIDDNIENDIESDVENDVKN
ncbi:hypothetical protein QLX08_002797 [Tetragonisca angustula]